MAGKKMYRTELKKGLPLMRTSFARNMFQGRENDSGVEKFGVTLILPKADAAGLRTLQEMVAEVVKGEWGEKGLERFKNGLIKNPILDGNGKEAHNKTSGELNAGMGPDVVFIRPTSNERVKVFDANVLPILDADGCPSGSWGIPVLNAFAWHNAQNGDGVSFGISMFQVTKVAEGDDVLGGGGSANPDAFFETVATSSDGNASGGAAGLFDA